MNSLKEKVSAYLKRLIDFKNQLEGQFDRMKINGSDIGSFIFIEHQKRSIELSELKNGGIWIEFWEEQSEDHHYQDCHGPVAEITLKKYDEASKILKDWLIKRSDLKEYPFIEWKKE